MKRNYFHGSDKKLTILKPVGVNMGYRWSKPEWAIYFWGDYDKAFFWSVYQYARRNTKIKTLYHIPTGKFAIMEKDRKELNRLLKGKATYVYSKRLPIFSMGFGSSPDIEEYTYSKEVIPDSVHEIIIDSNVLDKSSISMTDLEFKTYHQELIDGKYRGGRGFLFRLIMDSEKDMIRHKYNEKVKNGELSPGDDLSEVSLESLPSSFRW